MKKSSTVSFVLAENQYGVSSSGHRQIELLSVSSSQDCSIHSKQSADFDSKQTTIRPTKPRSGRVSSEERSTNTAKPTTESLRSGTAKSSTEVRTRRIVEKNGSCNVNYINIPERNAKFVSDFFTSVLDVRWRYLVALIFAGFVASWLLFSGLWFAIAKFHGDFDDVSANASKPVPCIWNCDGFVSVLLFSMETQTTIGYGYRYVSEECPLGVLLLAVQSLVGTLIQILFAGTILSKIQVPWKRSKTIAFSKLACISTVQGELCLMIRVGNLRLSEIVEANMRALFVLRKDELGNKIWPYNFREMRMGTHGDIDSRLTLWWPATIFHKINKSSPLFQMSRDVMQKCEFEIIVIMEGVVSSTSLNFQARTSYLQDEIVWGYEFAHTFKQDSSTSKFPVDFQHFDDVTAVQDISNMSAETLSKLPRRRQVPDQRSFCLLE
ncbi:ATP-sensitive inward rectifier potassium channel 12-like [Gigantopelta aegis]|uniref:ATP-sensitive inward rectifier potassium channel 12-like n=1 Tax=Gigantopelta aegis TaxID=1735272 RepID=UPI001B88A083|nr:ATP-sensitive inward rectifier potassium channel 12-like [Gigantopelta aegis]